MTPKDRSELSHRFIDSLFGADAIRVLLGLPGSSAKEQQRRAEDARDELMEAIARLRKESNTKQRT